MNTGNEYVEDLKRFWSIRSTNNPDVLFMFDRLDYKCSKIEFSKTQLWKVLIFLYQVFYSIQNFHHFWPPTLNRSHWTGHFWLLRRRKISVGFSWPSKKCLLIWPLEKSSGRVNLQNQKERIKKDFWKTFLLLKMYKKSKKGFV